MLYGHNLTYPSYNINNHNNTENEIKAKNMSRKKEEVNGLDLYQVI